MGEPPDDEPIRLVGKTIRLPPCARAGRTAVAHHRGERLRLAPTSDAPDPSDLEAVRSVGRCRAAPDRDRPVRGRRWSQPRAPQTPGSRCLLGADSDRVAAETHQHNIGGLELRRRPDRSDRAARPARRVGHRRRRPGRGRRPVSAVQPGRPVEDPGPGRERRAQRATRAQICGGASCGSSSSLHPRAVLVENVPDLPPGTTARVIGALRVAARPRLPGRRACPRRATSYGVPQHRRRLFLVGLLEGVPFEWPEPTGGPEHAPGRDRRPPGGPGRAARRRDALRRRPRHPAPAAAAAKLTGSLSGHRLRPHHPRRAPRRRRGVRAARRGPDLRGSPRASAAVPQRHLHRQVQAAGLGRAQPHDHGAHRQGRLLVHPPRAAPDAVDPRGRAGPDLPGLASASPASRASAIARSATPSRRLLGRALGRALRTTSSTSGRARRRSRGATSATICSTWYASASHVCSRGATATPIPGRCWSASCACAARRHGRIRPVLDAARRRIADTGSDRRRPERGPDDAGRARASLPQPSSSSTSPTTLVERHDGEVPDDRAGTLGAARASVTTLVQAVRTFAFASRRAARSIVRTRHDPAQRP